MANKGYRVSLLVASFFAFSVAHAETHAGAAATADALDSTRIDDCFTKGDTPNVCVLMRLSQFEAAYENDFESLLKEYGASISDPKSKSALLSNKGFVDRLNAISNKYDRVAQRLRADITEKSQKTKSKGLELIANFEIPRLQADLQSRLAIMALPDKVAAQKLVAKADALVSKTFESFKTISPKDREEAPGLMNRLVQTKLNILSLDQNSSSDSRRQLPDIKLREDRDFLQQARNLKPSKSESIELNMTELESYLNNSQSRGVGDNFPRPPEDYRDPERFDKLIGTLDASEKALAGVPGQEINLSQVKLLNLKSRFYSHELQKDAYQNLEEHLKSSDLATQQSAAEALNLLYKDFSGLSGSYNLMRIAERNSQVPDLDVPAIEHDYAQAAATHNKLVTESLGKLADKLNLPSYQRVLENQKDLGEPYMRMLNSLSGMSKKLNELQKKKASDDDMKLVLANVDLDWIDLQCASIASRGILRPGDEGLKVKTPLSSYKVDFTACLTAKDPKSRISVVGQISKNAINHDLYKNYAWLIGNFAFDVTTIALSGGVGTAVSKGVQAGFRATGKALLRRYAAHALIKAGVRGSAFVTKIVVADLVGQSMNAMKAFVADGLQNGNWDTQNLKPDIMKGQYTPGTYALRLMATQIATRAPWAVFGRVGTVAMKSARMQKVVSSLSKSKTAGSISAMRTPYKDLSKKILVEPVKGQINDLAANGLQSKLGVAHFDGLKKITSVDDWLTRYRTALLSLPGGKLGDKFGDRLRTLPTKYYSELSKAGDCLVSTSVAAAE